MSEDMKTPTPEEMRAIRTHLSLSFRSAWTNGLSPVQKQAVARDVWEIMQEEGDETDESEAVALLRERIGGSRNLLSYAKCVEHNYPVEG